MKGGVWLIMHTSIHPRAPSIVSRRGRPPHECECGYVGYVRWVGRWIVMYCMCLTPTNPTSYLPTYLPLGFALSGRPSGVDLIFAQSRHLYGLLIDVPLGIIDITTLTPIDPIFLSTASPWVPACKWLCDYGWIFNRVFMGKCIASVYDLE